MDLINVTYLVFGQAIPSLDADVRADVVDLINAGDIDVALDVLLRVVDRDAVPIDVDLLAAAKSLHASNCMTAWPDSRVAS